MDINIGMVLTTVILVAVGIFATLHLRKTKKNLGIDEGPAKTLAVIPSHEENDAIELHFGPSANQHILSVSRLPVLTISNSARRLKPDLSTVSRLGPLLQAVPSILAASELATGDYMQVIINGPLAAAKDGNGMLPWTRNAKGNIEKVARLKDPQTLSNLVNAAALLQIASVVVAQKHLADISKKLDAIKQGVDRIVAFQRDERKSIITGILKYYEQVAHAVLQGELPDSVRQKFEDYEGQLLAVQDHLTAELRREVENVDYLKDSDLFGSKGLQEVIKKHQLLIDDLHEQWILCLRARAAGWQLLSAFPGELHLKQARQRDIQSSMDILTAREGLLADVGERMDRKIATLKALWNKQSTLDQRKSDLREWTRSTIPAVRYKAGLVGQELLQGEAMLLEQQQPVILAFKVKAGEMVEAYQLAH